MSGLPFEGIKVLVTGEIEGFTRSGALQAVVALGGKSVGSVSGSTGLVVMGDGAGVSKMQKVRFHDLPVLEAEVFAALVADPSTWDGQPVGEPVSAYDTRLVALGQAPEPEPPLVLSEHRVGVAFVALRHAGRWIRQYRRSCACGHYWLSPSPTTASGPCPVAASRVPLCTTPPWKTDPYAEAPMPVPDVAPVRVESPRIETAVAAPWHRSPVDDFFDAVPVPETEPIKTTPVATPVATDASDDAWMYPDVDEPFSPIDTGLSVRAAW